MKTKLSGNQRDNIILRVLFISTFLIHLIGTVWASNDDSFAHIEKLQRIASSAYSDLGFEWNGAGAYVVTAALVTSFITNIVRRFFEGILLGWPRFKAHDRNSLTRAVTLLIGYGAMMYVAIGFFGEKYSSRNLDSINIFIIAISTYIVGLLVDFVDDVVSGFYYIYMGDRT